MNNKINKLKLCKNFKNLVNYTDQFNIFSFMGIEENEFIHSNILASLLDPESTFNLSENFRQKLLSKICSETNFKKIKNTKPDVYREKYFIDLILDFKHEKILVAFENKINAFERKNQLKDYQNLINNIYNNYSIVFVFLTPNGRKPTSAINEKDIPIVTISYNNIRIICKKLIKNNNSNTDFFLKQFISHLEEDIMNNSDTFKMCKKIYKEHTEAYEALVDEYYNVYDEVVNENIIDMFKDLETTIINNENLNVKTDLKIKKKRNKRLVIELDVRNINWPKPIAIKIYKNYIFGVLPYLSTKDKDDKLEEKLKEIFGLSPKKDESWDKITYFTKELINSDDPAETRCVKREGDKINMDDIYRGHEKFLKIYDKINSKLKNI